MTFRATLRTLNEQEFQSLFEVCGDSDPYGLCLNGVPIGLVDVRWDPENLMALENLGIDLIEG